MKFRQEQAHHKNCRLAVRRIVFVAIYGIVIFKISAVVVIVCTVVAIVDVVGIAGTASSATASRAFVNGIG
jgi:hypothetical protein